jgi:hypothetical protein
MASLTFFVNGKCQRQVLLDIASVVFELDETMIQVGIERGEVIEEVALLEPPRCAKYIFVS